MPTIMPLIPRAGLEPRLLSTGACASVHTVYNRQFQRRRRLRVPVLTHDNYIPACTQGRAGAQPSEGPALPL